MTKALLLSGGAVLALTLPALANCPAVTVADLQGLSPDYPQQFELAEFEAKAACDLGFAENPEIAALNGEILGNGALPPVSERLPQEPLVVAPYAAIGSYGGTLTGLSRGTESGTSDLLSVRHVNLVRYSDDLQTIVPNVARSWEWNDDFTKLTFTLRQGHKWSDGAPFTAEDVAFWYNDVLMNPAVIEKAPGRWLFDGQPATVEAIDETTVTFTLPVAQPNLLNRWAIDYGQTFLPKHFLGRYLDKYNADAAALRAAHGFADEAEAVNFFYGNSDWKDVPSPLMKDADKVAAIGTAVMPTLESHIVVEENTEGRHLVANPYFHMVDTAGNQLPYISEINEEYVPEREVVNLRIMNGEVTWKQQAMQLNDFPLLKENEGKGDYTVALAPTLGQSPYYSFNRTHKDPVLREIFSDVRFSQALSLGLDRNEINEIVYLGQGKPMQTAAAEHVTVPFLSAEDLTDFTEYDPARANALLDEMGLARGSDGVRRRPDGKPLSIRITFASQGTASQLHELAAGYWSDLGIQVDVREVTSDEYRAAANANEVDVLTWKNDGVSGPNISQDVTDALFPGDPFNPKGHADWATWIETDGAEGMEPPAYIKRLFEVAGAFIKHPLGTDESNALGAEMMKIHLDNMIKIGVVSEIPEPYVYANALKNVPALTAKAYDYYWTYPYRPQQWWLEQ
ncbi:peptide/nickel transport system substrate-binding protein [Rhodovulum bhavnagarense]|uniref:Peptide/nickel transport system substrate-binding protein n=1 Tax=Rhodovulum bhavnagarense TaxID=992286 RepID=A0A4R2RLA5_9RHOB|nr:ABC transporter substrate-binding protein [Rhodovulum bhavnagarense]TCP60511.1 peptide/nickel transport system substrate-binding protein [Rhodovulum bhavnagarense]